MAGRDSLFFRTMTLLLKVRSPFDMAKKTEDQCQGWKYDGNGMLWGNDSSTTDEILQTSCPRGSSFTKRFLDKGAPPHHIGRQSGAPYKDSGSASPSSLAVSRP